MEIPLKLCGGLFKAVQVEVRGDEFSNLKVLEASYSLPRSFKGRGDLAKALVTACKLFETSECKVSSIGWGDPRCKTYKIAYTVVPCGGIKYCK